MRTRDVLRQAEPGRTPGRFHRRRTVGRLQTVAGFEGGGRRDARGDGSAVHYTRPGETQITAVDDAARTPGCCRGVRLARESSKPRARGPDIDLEFPQVCRFADKPRPKHT